ncbi:hypothetical protein L0337_07505 [candidate division KSB1 bacterium]|nr:hypothetical protein [candidate division KSB1 bacterium]
MELKNPKRLLIRLQELVGDSQEYFVSGSLSFLPRLNNYRQPHDVDVAVSRELFQTRRSVLDPSDDVRILRLSEVAIAEGFPIAKVLTPRTGFVHVFNPDGLLDISCYSRTPRGFVFSLGFALSLEVPGMIQERFRLLNWEGVSYKAGPPELAFIPKAVSCLRAGSERREQDRQDLKQLVSIVDWDFIRKLLGNGGLRWFGRRLPKPIRMALDPFASPKLTTERHFEGLQK